MISQCIQQMAMKILKENPNIANNPNAQSMINVIQSGDEKKGQEIAENICKSMGVSKEDAIRQAEQFFHVNYRALHDEMVKMQMDAKDQTIASQQAAINKLELTASQCAQNQYLVNQLRPAAVPAFTVPNPYANYGFGCYCGSSNNGCC